MIKIVMAVVVVVMGIIILPMLGYSFRHVQEQYAYVTCSNSPTNQACKNMQDATNTEYVCNIRGNCWLELK